jgi:hypothetical protein
MHISLLAGSNYSSSQVNEVHQLNHSKKLKTFSPFPNQSVSHQYEKGYRQW